MDKEADLQGSVGLRISKKGPPFLVEAVDVVIDEQGCLQGHRAYKNPIVNVNDRLVAVDGCTAETMERLAPGSIQTALKGPRGSIVELAFISAVTGSVFSIRVARHMVKEVVSEIMSTEALKDAAGIRQKEAPCGIGVTIGRHDFHDDTQPCYILKLSAGGSALQSGEIDVGDVRPAGRTACISSSYILLSFRFPSIIILNIGLSVRFALVGGVGRGWDAVLPASTSHDFKQNCWTTRNHSGIKSEKGFAKLNISLQCIFGAARMVCFFHEMTFI